MAEEEFAMILMEYLLNLNRKIIQFLEKIALHFSRQIYYDNFDDCYDWVDHTLYIFGIYILHRKVMKNNRVKFFKKSGFALYLTKFIAICNCFFIILITYIYGWMRFTKILHRYEIILTLLYISNGVVVMIILMTSPSFGICFEKLKDLHFEIDILMKQLRLPVDYSPVMIIAAVVQIVIYGYLLISACYGTYEFLLEDNNKFVVFYEYLMIAVIIVSTMFIIIQHAGMLITCYTRSWLVNQLLRKKIYSGHVDEIESYDNHGLLLYNSRSLNIMFQLIIDFHSKQNEIAKTVKDFTASTNLIMTPMYSANAAFLFYNYYYDSFFEYKSFIAYVLCSMGFVCFTLSGQLFKWQAQQTVNLISDWTICYLNEEFIQNRNSLLLQMLHDRSDDQYDGIIKVNNSLWIVMIEISITILVYIIQSFD